MRSVLTATNDLLEDNSCQSVILSVVLGLLQFVTLFFYSLGDRRGCKPRAALGPAALCSLVHRQRELPGDARDAAAAGGGHAEAGIAGTDTGPSGVLSGPWEKIRF